MKAKISKPFLISQPEHHGGKKLSQQSTQFFHKEHEVRKQPKRGFLVRKG